jgi:hypothetical protein
MEIMKNSDGKGEGGARCEPGTSKIQSMSANHSTMFNLNMLRMINKLNVTVEFYSVSHFEISS